MRLRIDKFPGLNEADNMSVPLGTEQKLVFSIDEAGNLRPGYEAGNATEIKQQLSATNPVLENYDIYTWAHFENSNGVNYYLAQYWDGAAGKYRFAKSYEHDRWGIVMNGGSALEFAEIVESQAFVMLNDRIYFSTKSDGLWEIDTTSSDTLTQRQTNGSKYLCIHQGLLVGANFTGYKNTVKWGSTGTPYDWAAGSLAVSAKEGQIVGIGTFLGMKDGTVEPTAYVFRSTDVHILQNFPASGYTNKRISSIGCVPRSIAEVGKAFVFMGEDNQVYIVYPGRAPYKISGKIENYLTQNTPENLMSAINDSFSDPLNMRAGLPADYTYNAPDKLYVKQTAGSDTISGTYTVGGEAVKKEYVNCMPILDNRWVAYAMVWQASKGSTYITGIDTVVINRGGIFKEYNKVIIGDRYHIQIRVFGSNWVIFANSYVSGNYSKIIKMSMSYLLPVASPYYEITATTLSTAATNTLKYFPADVANSRLYWSAVEYSGGSEATGIKYYDTSFNLGTPASISGEKVRIWSVRYKDAAYWFLASKILTDTYYSGYTYDTGGTEKLYIFETSAHTNKTYISPATNVIARAAFVSDDIVVYFARTFGDGTISVFLARGEWEKMSVQSESIGSIRYDYPWQWNDLAAYDTGDEKALYIRKVLGSPTNQFFLKFKSYALSEAAWGIFDTEIPVFKNDTNNRVSQSVPGTTQLNIKYAYKSHASNYEYITDEVYLSDLTSMVSFEVIREQAIADGAYGLYGGDIETTVYYSNSTTPGWTPSWTEFDWKKIYTSDSETKKYWRFKIVTNKGLLPDRITGFNIIYKTVTGYKGLKITATNIDGKYALIYHSGGYTLLWDPATREWMPADIISDDTIMEIEAVWEDTILYRYTGDQHYLIRIGKGDDIRYKMLSKSTKYTIYDEIVVDAEKMNLEASGTLTVKNHSRSLGKQRGRVPHTVQGRNIDIMIDATKYLAVRSIEMEGKVVRGR